MTYSVNGKQYVVLASATDIFAFGLFEPMRPAPLTLKGEIRNARDQGRRSMTANAPAPQPLTPETRVLQVIRLFLREIGSQRASDALSMQASLERNLGLGSLERVELIDRLEREFAIQLPEQVLTEAETPADLVGALMRHSSLGKEGEPLTYPKPSQRSSWTAKTDASQASAAVLPESGRPSAIQLSGVETLNEALFHYARLDPSRLHVCLYREGDEQETISYAQLLAGSLAVSAGLADQGLQAGQTAALMLPTGKEFFFAFLGILLAGGIPVPIYPPFKAARLEEYAKRQSPHSSKRRSPVSHYVPPGREVGEAVEAQHSQSEGSVQRCRFVAVED